MFCIGNENKQMWFASIKEVRPMIEMQLLIKSHPLVKLLSNGVDILHKNFSFFINYGGLAQHYYNKTRFLDLTSDMEAMKFFATTNYNWNNDEYTPVLDTNELGIIYCYELQMPDAFHLHYHCELPAPYPAFHNTVHCQSHLL